MPPVEFERIISAGERPQTYALEWGRNTAEKISHPEDAVNVFLRNVWTFNHCTVHKPKTRSDNRYSSTDVT
jgi:hypothetical protein